MFIHSERKLICKLLIYSTEKTSTLRRQFSRDTKPCRHNIYEQKKFPYQYLICIYILCFIELYGQCNTNGLQ